MIVWRATMDAAVAAERERYAALANTYGDALARVSALQKLISAWVLNEAGTITPRQMAQMFYAQDDSWQAAFFNVMQDEILAYHDSNRASEFSYAGVPAGEGQWFHMSKHLDDSGRETLASMHEHATAHSAREIAA